MQQLLKISPELNRLPTRIDNVVDAPVPLGRSLHFINQPAWNSTGYTSKAHIHIHLSLNTHGLRWATTDHFCPECFGLGITEYIEIDKDAIMHRFESSGTVQQLEERRCKALTLAGESLIRLTPLLHWLNVPEVKASNLIHHTCRAWSNEFWCRHGQQADDQKRIHGNDAIENTEDIPQNSLEQQGPNTREILGT